MSHMIIGEMTLKTCQIDDALRFVLHTFDNFLCHQRFTAEHVMKLNVLAHVATNTTGILI